MSLIVQKYGGTSVGDPERIRNVARRVVETQKAGNKVVVVVSAMSGVTDQLIQLARQVSTSPAEREMDVLLATGEQTTIALTAMAINSMGSKAVSLTGGQAGIITDGVHTKAKIANISPKQIHGFLKDGCIVIVAGFQGVHKATGRVTTLGRGGSDTSAYSPPSRRSLRSPFSCKAASSIRRPGVRCVCCRDCVSPEFTWWRKAG